MALFIAVRPNELDLSPWNAMLVSRTEQGLRNMDRYRSSNSRDIPRSAQDYQIDTQVYRDEDSGNNTTLHLFCLPGRVSSRIGFR